jgi:hypothetical protein
MIRILNPHGFVWHLARRVINSLKVLVAAERSKCCRIACIFREHCAAVGTPKTNNT